MKPKPPVHTFKESERLWLFLDYDGTLADFAPTPDVVTPDIELIDLLARLVRRADTRVAIISGRRLKHIQKLAPVPGMLLAGTYGIELQVWDGEQVNQIEYEKVRPVLKKIKPRWEELIDGKSGFYLEDKGYALAIHAANAEDSTARQILDQAVRVAKDEGISDPFLLFRGNKFLELASRLANKGTAIRYLLDKFPWPGALLVYIGDDDKDELAFKAINEAGGISILVSGVSRDTEAQYQVDSPEEVRKLLREVSYM